MKIARLDARAHCSRCELPHRLPRRHALCAPEEQPLFQMPEPQSEDHALAPERPT